MGYPFPEAPLPPGLGPTWYPEPEPINPWEDYALSLEEENRYLRSMLLQYVPTLPPSVIPPHRQPPPEMDYGLNNVMSPSAVPFCPQWGPDAHEGSEGSSRWAEARRGVAWRKLSLKAQLLYSQKELGMARKRP